MIFLYEPLDNLNNIHKKQQISSILTSFSNFLNACHPSNMSFKYPNVGLHQCFTFYMY